MPATPSDVFTFLAFPLYLSDLWCVFLVFVMVCWRRPDWRAGLVRSLPPALVGAARADTRR